MTIDRESFGRALEDHDITLALTPTQVVLLAIGVFLLFRFIRGFRGFRG